MKVSKIREMMNSIDQFIEVAPQNVVQDCEVSKEEIEHFKKVQIELQKQKLKNAFDRFAFYTPGN